MENFTERKTPAGLYSPRFEHDNCGIGAVVDIKGRKSHKTIDDALQIVEHLEHRAGKDAEGKTGDGVGILTQISDKFFQKAAAEQGLTLGAEREYGIGMFFFPQDELKRNQAKKLFEIVCKKEGLPFLGWREVPTCPEVLGHKAIACMPSIWQGFVGKPQRVEAGIAFDRRLYVARRVFEHLLHVLGQRLGQCHRAVALQADRDRTVRAGHHAVEAVAHQKIGLFPAGAEPCDEPPVPEQRVTGKFDAALDVIEQPVPLCAGIAQAIDGKFRRSTGCCRFKLGPQRQQPVRLQLNGGIVCVILCCHGPRLGKIEPQYIPSGMCNVRVLRGKAGQSNAGGVKRKRFFHFITPAFG